MGEDRHERLRGDVVVARQSRSVALNQAARVDAPRQQRRAHACPPGRHSGDAARSADRLQERFRVEILAHLHQGRRQRRERRRSVRTQDGRRLARRRVADVVDVHGRAGERDAVRDEGVSQDRHEEQHRHRAPRMQRERRLRRGELCLRRSRLRAR